MAALRAGNTPEAIPIIVVSTITIEDGTNPDEIKVCTSIEREGSAAGLLNLMRPDKCCASLSAYFG